MNAVVAETITVNLEVRGVFTLLGEVEMTRAEYEEWCEKIDGAKGWEKERVAEELIGRANLNMRHGDVQDLEVEDFNEAGSDG